MTKHYNKGTDLGPRVLGAIKEADWLDFLMTRDGFGEGPKEITDNGYEVTVTQDDEFTGEVKTGYSYEQHQFYKKGGMA